MPIADKKNTAFVIVGAFLFVSIVGNVYLYQNQVVGTVAPAPVPGLKDEKAANKNSLSALNSEREMMLGTAYRAWFTYSGRQIVAASPKSVSGNRVFSLKPGDATEVVFGISGSIPNTGTRTYGVSLKSIEHTGNEAMPYKATITFGGKEYIVESDGFEGGPRVMSAYQLFDDAIRVYVFGVQRDRVVLYVDSIGG